MRNLLAGLLVGVVAVAVTAAALLLGMYRASQQVPEFYQRALAHGAAEQDCSERFERQALALHNQVRRSGQWEARFTEEEINAWLAATVPEKFPQALSSGVSEPRVAIEGDIIRLAVRYARGSTSTVVSLAARLHLTDEPNQIAVEIREARSGALPLPLAGFLDEIKAHASQAGIALQWTESAGRPVALFRLPLESPLPDKNETAGRRIQLERLQLLDRALVVAGRTEGADGGPSQPAESLAGSEDQPGEELASPISNETRQR